MFNSVRDHTAGFLDFNKLLQRLFFNILDEGRYYFLIVWGRLLDMMLSQVCAFLNDWYNNLEFPLLKTRFSL